MRDADWGAATDTGQHRAHNEDNFLVGPNVVAVADGMGGHQAGEVASKIAVGVLAGLADLEVLTTEDLQTAVGRAHDEIANRARLDRSMTGMGTTLAGVAVVTVGGAPHWAVFNVGDSRIYRRADDTIAQVSVDHSEVEELVAGGILTREQAHTDFRRNIITRSLGGDVRPVADLWVFPQVEGEQFLICSDGLSNELSDDEILGVLRAAESAQVAADALVAAAVRAGGHDNVTTIVLGSGHRIDEPSADAGNQPAEQPSADPGDPA